MASPAPIRLAGTIVATAMFGAAATEALAQDGALVLNNQLQLGDVVAGQTLDVVDIGQQATVSNAAQGAVLIGAAENSSLDLRSSQTMQGRASAVTRMTLGGDTGGLVTGVTQARGTYLAGTADDARLLVDAVQSTQHDVSARSEILNSDARLIGGANVASGAFGNTVALSGSGSAVSGRIDQSASGDVRAANLAATRYLPGAADFSSHAVANAAQVTSGASSNQRLSVRQRAAGGIVEAATSPSAGNAWNLAGRSAAAGNQAAFYNQGGAQLIAADQENEARIRAAARVFAYDFGAAHASAEATANQLVVGNNDVYVEVDNVQLNTGGVEAGAVFEGARGYDAYVGANATGNSVTGYACSECRGMIEATNNQVNAGAVSAQATTVVSGQGRAVVTGANAIGNAATFYITGSGGGG